MKDDCGREEISRMIKESFDKSIPNDYVRNMMLVEIEEKNEDNTGKRTIMENMFRVRKLCMACLLLILIVALPGGTYTVVSMVNRQSDDTKKPEKQKDNETDVGKGQDKSGNKEDGGNGRSKEEDYSHLDTVVRAFRGEINVTDKLYRGGQTVLSIVDRRLADAFSECEFKNQTKALNGIYAITYLGNVGGNGISDRQFDKKEYRKYAAFAIKKFIADNESYSVTDEDGQYVCSYYNTYASNMYVHVGGIDENDYTLSFVYKFKYDDYEYYIYDITAMCALSKDAFDISISYPIETAQEYDTSDYITSIGSQFETLDFCIDDIETKGYEWYPEYKKKVKKMQYACDYLAMEYVYRQGEVFDDVKFYNKHKKLYKSLDEVHALMKIVDERERRYYNINNSNKTLYGLSLYDMRKEFRKKNPATITGASGMDYTMTAHTLYVSDDFTDEYNGETGVYNIYDRRSTWSFKGITVKPGVTDSHSTDSITVNVSNARRDKNNIDVRIYRKIKASAEQEKEYEKLGYIGSVVNEGSKDGEKNRYIVYMDCGDSITIPLSRQSDIEDYGIYLSYPPVNCSEYDNYYDMRDADNNKALYAMADDIGVEVAFNIKGVTDVEKIKFEACEYYNEYEELHMTLLCGWEN